MKVLITGSKGFVGKNLCSVLRRYGDISLYEFDVEDSFEYLDSVLSKVDIIFHLAGVNRPKSPSEFETGNAGSIKDVTNKLIELKRTPKIVLSSSIQADLENPYGVSKRHAEDTLYKFAGEMDAECVVYRLKNLFGKWCRPNYNSVAATFCHNIANDQPIQISDPAYEIELTHIDDVVSAFVDEIKPGKPGLHFAQELPSYRISLGTLAEKIRSFRQTRANNYLPMIQNKFDHDLYGTYLSYLDEKDFQYTLDIKSDPRGSLAEFIKSPKMGQIFVSRTKPGITRGDHYHHTKTEKFLVLQGTAIIRFRNILSDHNIEYQVRGDEYKVLDIPTGYTHSIENVGNEELVTLFWASEVFDPDRPDTYFEKVLSVTGD